LPRWDGATAVWHFGEPPHALMTRSRRQPGTWHMQTSYLAKLEGLDCRRAGRSNLIRKHRLPTRAACSYALPWRISIGGQLHMIEKKIK